MRLFTFGCSFTNFLWPTWADILARHYTEHSNWGRLGAGNHFIFNSLMECIKREKITSDDTVGIMWSSIGREDRYVRDQWLNTGSILTQRVYDSSFVEKFADPTGYLLRDLSYISASRQILDSIGCRYYFFSMVPLACFEDFFEKFFSIDSKILRVYAEDLDVLYPSIYEIVFNNNWFSRPGYKDWHTLEKNYYECRGDSWPESWQEFLTKYDNNMLGDLEEEILDRYEFRRKLIRMDYHPTPKEHLLYLKSVVPDMINKEDEFIVDIIDQQVLLHSWKKDSHKQGKVLRF